MSRPGLHLLVALGSLAVALASAFPVVAAPTTGKIVLLATSCSPTFPLHPAHPYLSGPGAASRLETRDPEPP